MENDNSPKILGRVDIDVNDLRQNLSAGESSIERMNKKLLELQKTLRSFDTSLGKNKGDKNAMEGEIQAIEQRVKVMEEALKKQVEAIKNANAQISQETRRQSQQRKTDTGRAEEEQTNKTAQELRRQLEIHTRAYNQKLTVTRDYARQVEQIEARASQLGSGKQKQALEQQIINNRISMLGRLRQHAEQHTQEMTVNQRREIEGLRIKHNSLKNQYSKGIIDAQTYYRGIKELQKSSMDMPTDPKMNQELQNSMNTVVQAWRKKQESLKANDQAFQLDLIKQQREGYNRRIRELQNGLKNEEHSMRNHREKMKNLRKEIAMSGHSTDLVQTTTKEIEKTNRAIQHRQVEHNKRMREEQEKASKRRLEATQARVKREFEAVKSGFQAKYLSAREYYQSIRRFEIENMSKKMPQQFWTNVSETKERAYNQRVGEMIGNRIQMRKNEQVQNLSLHQHQMARILQMERLTANQKKAIRSEIAQVERMRRKQAEQEEIAHQKRMKQAGLVHGSPQQKFRTLSNYAFNATLIYGSIRALREMQSVIRDIESASIDLQRVMPQADQFDIASLRGEAFGIGFDTSQAVTDVQKIQNLWSRTSDEIANNRQALEYLTRVTATAMNIGGFTDAQEAVQLMNATLNQMNLHWTDAESVLNSWSKTANTTAVRTAKELADSTMRVGAQAQKLGLEYHDINAITGVLANNMARSGEEIGTALKTIFTYMLRDKTVETLERHGIEVMKTANEYHHFLYIMQQLNKTYRDLELSRNQTAIREIDESLGRVRRIDYVGNLLGNFGEFNDILSGSIDSAGYAMEQNEIVMESMDAQLRNLRNSFAELAWELGEAGLMSDMSYLISTIADGIRSFGDLDDSTKAFIYRLGMMGIALTVASKAMQLFTGHSLRGAMMNLSTSLPNAGRAIANFAKWLTGANTAMAIGTKRSVRLAKATGSYTKVAGGALVAQKGFTASLAGFINPATAVLAVLAGSVAIYSSYQAKMKQAREEMELMEKAQRDFANMSNRSHIPEHEIGHTEKEIDDRIKKLKEYTEAVENLENEMDGGTKTVTNRGEVFEVMTGSAREAKENVEDLEKELKMLGITMDEIQRYANRGLLPDDLLKLQGLVANSHNRQFREMADLMDEISNTVEQNKWLAEMVSEYRDLYNAVDDSTEAKEDFLEVNKLLTSAYPELLGQMDHDLGVRVMQIDALEEVTKNVYALSDSQIDNLTHSRAWSDEMISGMRGMTTKSNLMTQSMIRESKARITAMRAELSSMEILSGFPSARTMLSPSGMDNFYDLKNEEENLRNYNSELKRLDILIQSLDEIETRTGQGISDTSPSSTSDSTNDHRIDVDRYYHLELAITRYNDALERNKGLQSLTHDEHQRQQLMQQEINMLNLKTQATDDLNRAQKEERDEINQRLSAVGFEIVNNEIKNLNENIKRFSGETAQAVEADLNRFKDLVSNVIPSSANEMMNLRTQVLGVQDAIAQMNEEMIDAKVALFNQIEDKVVAIVKDRIDEEKKLEMDKINSLEQAESKRHQNAMDRLNAERDAFNRFINEKLRALSDEADKESFEEDLKRLTDERIDLQRLYDELMMDDRIESQSRAYDIAKQIADKEFEIEKLQRDRTRSEREKSLNDQMDRYDQEHQRKVDLEQRATQAEQEALNERLRRVEQHYDDRLEQGALFAEAQKYMTERSFEELANELTEFEDRFGDGMRMTGDLIKSEMIDNLQKVIDLMAQINYSGGSGAGMGLTNFVNTGGSSLGSGMSQDMVSQMIYQAGQDWNIANMRGDQAGMAEAHRTAEELRRANDRPHGDSSGAYDALYEEWKRKMGLSAHTGGLLNFQGSNEKMIMAHKGELVSNPIDTKRLLKISLLLNSAFPRIRSVVGNTGKTKDMVSLNIGKLVEVNGSMMAEQMHDVDRFANSVVGKLHSELKKRGGA